MARQKNPQNVGPVVMIRSPYDISGDLVLDEGQGGLGKTICMTAVAEAIKAQNPDVRLIVKTSYPEVWKGLRSVDRFLPMQPRPYQRDEIANAEYLRVEPYLDRAWRHGLEHLIATWCRLLGVRPPMEMRGKIHLTQQEKDDAAKLLQSVDRPIIALQWTGGVSNQNPQAACALGKFNQIRHLPQKTAQAIVDILYDAGFAVLQISLPTEPKLEKVLFLDQANVTPTRLVFALLDRCVGLIGIDSFAQHAWAALGKKDAVVLWGYSNPTSYGYATNNNLTAPRKLCNTPHCNRPESHLGDVQGDLSPWECPFDGECMKFDPRTVADAAMRAAPPPKIEKKA